MLAETRDVFLAPTPVDSLDEPARTIEAELERVAVATPPVDQAVELEVDVDPVRGQRRIVERSDEIEHALHTGDLGTLMMTTFPAPEEDQSEDHDESRTDEPHGR